MSELEAEAASMASLVVASLSRSFHQVPPSAVPATLDCILVSTGLPPRSLFASLLHDFPRLLKVLLFLIPIDCSSLEYLHFYIVFFFFFPENREKTLKTTQKRSVGVVKFALSNLDFIDYCAERHGQSQVYMD